MTEYPLTLADAIERSFFNLGLLKGIFAGIVVAVAGCHSQGIAHCDIKPANIGLSKGLVPVLLDFGCIYMAHHAKNKWRGTRCYSPPET